MPLIYLTDQQVKNELITTPSVELRLALEAAGTDDWSPFEDAAEAGLHIIGAALDWGPWWYHAEFDDSASIVLIQAEDPDDSSSHDHVEKQIAYATVAELHARHVTHGIPVPAEGRGYGHLETGGDDLSSYDAISADVALQIAVFGEVIYG